MACTHATSTFRIRFNGDRDLRHIAALASGDSSGRSDAESHHGTHDFKYRDSLPITESSCPMDYPTLSRRRRTVPARRDAVLFAVRRCAERGGYHGGIVHEVGDRRAIRCRDEWTEVRAAGSYQPRSLLIEGSIGVSGSQIRSYSRGNRFLLEHFVRATVTSCKSACGEITPMYLENKGNSSNVVDILIALLPAPA